MTRAAVEIVATGSSEQYRKLVHLLKWMKKEHKTLAKLIEEVDFAFSEMPTGTNGCYVSRNNMIEISRRFDINTKHGSDSWYYVVLKQLGYRYLDIHHGQNIGNTPFNILDSVTDAFVALFIDSTVIKYEFYETYVSRVYVNIEDLQWVGYHVAVK